MRVLLTGATGSLGSHTARALVAAGHAVRVLVRDPARLARRTPELAGVLDVARGDLLQPDTLAPACDGADALVHAAARLAGGDADVERVNAAGSAALVAAAARAGVARVVLASSIAVYRDGPLVEASEDAPRGGGSAYARSKARAEDAALAASAAGGPRACVLRLPALVDRRDDPFLSALADAVARYALPTTATGGARLELVHSADAARALVGALVAPLGPPLDTGAVWNLGGRRRRAAELAHAAAAALGVEARLFEVPADLALDAPPAGWERRGAEWGRPALPWALVPAALVERTVDGRRAAAALGWAPRIGILEYVTRTLGREYD